MNCYECNSAVNLSTRIVDGVERVLCDKCKWRHIDKETIAEWRREWHEKYKEWKEPTS